MFISKNKYERWQISQKATDQNKNELKDDAGNTLYANMPVQFKKGCEPKEDELNNYGSYEIKELWAIDSNNRKRKAYLLPNIYKNNQGLWVKETKLVLGDWEFTTLTDNDEVSVWHDGDIDTSKFGGTQLPPDEIELPFY